jgi:hypothetical protein
MVALILLINYHIDLLFLLIYWNNIMSIHANLPVGAKRKSRHKRGRSATKIPLSGPRGTRGYPV